MGRRSQGWSLRWHKATGTWLVWWWQEGKRSERSTGIRRRRDLEAARAEAARLYTAAITGTAQQRPAAAAHGRLRDWVAQWLADLPLRPRTQVQYEVYSMLWLRRWQALTDLTAQQLTAYMRLRLRETRGKSVRNELSALRNLLRWLVERGALASMPAVPTVPVGALGCPYRQKRRTRAPELSPAELRRWIAALPEQSSLTHWPIRARFVVAYETTLRPGTLDRLRVPENYSRGSKTLRVREEDDKEGMARDVPLSTAARKALDAVCPDVGLIFGAHRYDRYIKRAARRALPPHKAAIACGQHMRSAAITHMLEDSGNVPGVQYLAGHVRASTTALYVRPSIRAARDVLRKRRR
jgi:site-specific recombinase XerC